MNYLKHILIQYGWNVRYYEFNIDFAKSYDEQIFELNEDLVLAIKNDYILDIGWYPEMNPNGFFRTRLIKNYDWERPIVSIKDRTNENLLLHVKKIITDFSS